MKRKVPIAVWILGAMVLGIIVGYMINIQYPDKKSAAEIAGYVSLGSDIFLRLIKMLIGPLVFSTLASVGASPFTWETPWPPSAGSS